MYVTRIVRLHYQRVNGTLQPRSEAGEPIQTTPGSPRPNSRSIVALGHGPRVRIDGIHEPVQPTLLTGVQTLQQAGHAHIR